MKYFLSLLFACTMIYSMDTTVVTEDSLKKEFKSLAIVLNHELLCYAKPKQIERHLDEWTRLKTAQASMPPHWINKILVTARTAQELAQVAARKQAKIAGPQIISASKNYVNAQLNYQAICTYLNLRP